MDEDLKVAADTEQSAGTDETAQPLAEEAKEAVKEETSDASAEESTAEKTDGETIDEKSVEEEIDAILEEDDTKKDGVQRRIDKLVAEKKAKDERIAELEARLNEKVEKKEEPKYTEEQLKRALNKAIAEGDADLVWEIQQYQLKQVKDELKNEYTSEQKRMRETAERIAQEWNNTVEQYQYLAKEELYPRSTQELDITNQNSLLYQVALKLFTDPQLRSVYQVPGGQKLAVADALQQIIRKRKVNAGSSDAELLKRKLAKEKRKSSLGTGESLKEDAPPPRKPGSEKERLDDYINERKKFQADRILGT